MLIAQLLQAVRMNVPLHGYLHSQLDLALNTLLPTLDKRMLDMNTSNLNEELNTDFLNPELLGRFLSPVVVTAVELGAGYPVCLLVRVWVLALAFTSTFQLRS